MITIVQKMKLIKYIIALIFSLTLVMEDAFVLSCPVNCKCRGLASACGSGIYGTLPVGLDSSTKYLGISGSESDRNNITILHKADFQGLRNLFSLSITFSGVQRVEDSAFSFLQNLGILDLANNDIQNLTASSFKGLGKLVLLDLSGNKNCGLRKALFTNIGTVEELNLGDMNLKALENGLFDFVPRLKKLRLYANDLTKLSANVFAPVTYLKFLDISTNKLSALQIELKPMFTKLRQLNLAENPWQCNCQMIWLHRLPLTMTISVPDLKDIICHGPDNLKYLSFNNVVESMLRCIPIEIKKCENVSLSIEENKLITIPCVFEGDPPPEIKWTRPDGHEIVGRETTEGNYEIFKNGTMFIHTVTSKDNGDWMVSAYNKSSHVEKRININVISLSTSTAMKSTTIKTAAVSMPTTTRKSATARPSVRTSAHPSALTPWRPKSGSMSLFGAKHDKTILSTVFISVVSLLKLM